MKRTSVYGLSGAVGAGLVFGGMLLGLLRSVATGDGLPGIRQEPLRDAARLKASGDRERARIEYEHAAALNPGDYDLLMNAGLGLTDLGASAGSAPILLRAHRLRRDRPEPLIALGWALVRAGQFTPAEAAFNDGLRLDRRNASALAGLGEVALENERLDRARAAFEASLAIEPGAAEVHNSLGIALALSGEARRAIAEFERAVRLKPERSFRANLERARKAAGAPVSAPGAPIETGPAR